MSQRSVFPGSTPATQRSLRAEGPPRSLKKRTNVRVIRRKKGASRWGIREWGSFASIASAALLFWLSFGPRYAEQRRQLQEGAP